MGKSMISWGYTNCDDRTVGPLMIYDSAKRSSAPPRSPCLRMRRTCSQVVRSVSKVDYSLYLDESRGLKASGTDSPIRRIAGDRVVISR